MEVYLHSPCMPSWQVHVQLCLYNEIYRKIFCHFPAISHLTSSLCNNIHSQYSEPLTNIASTSTCLSFKREPFKVSCTNNVCPSPRLVLKWNCSCHWLVTELITLCSQGKLYYSSNYLLELWKTIIFFFLNQYPVNLPKEI